MSTTEEAAAATTTTEAASPVEEEEKQNDSSSFLEAATSAMTQQAAEPDIENQQPQRPPLLPATDKSIGILAPRKSNRNKPNNNGEENDDDDGSSTDSVFSFDSYEMKVTSRRIPLKFQSVINNPNNNTTGASSTAVPFPSVNATTLDHSSSAVATAENVCPCRCLFFTVKESICLVMSALGCAVFLAGLVVLCLYLEGTLFEDEYLEK
mmetsp:Transcript_31325/g.47000  ORF Transcript_31325/g.47000 Transcript_31325/m.47000 type:complete len:209 (+) Transcript_31325:50-676(+)